MSKFPNFICQRKLTTDLPLTDPPPALSILENRKNNSADKNDGGSPQPTKVVGFFSALIVVLGIWASVQNPSLHQQHKVTDWSFKAESYGL